VKNVRAIYVAYGDVSRIPVKANAKPLDALLQVGFDLFLEVAPKKWVRAVDLPDNHPANVNFKAGAYKTGITDANGQTFTILNAYNPQHRQLAAREGLYIAVPYSPDKREELLKTLESLRKNFEILMESRLIDLQERINRIKERLELLKELKAVEKQNDEKAKAQALWDSTVNDAAHLLDKVVELSNEIFPTNYERWAFQEAVRKAKREAALEEAIEESILLNPEKLRELRQKMLE